jgi:hypothetical protein
MSCLLRERSSVLGEDKVWVVCEYSVIFEVTSRLRIHGIRIYRLKYNWNPCRVVCLTFWSSSLRVALHLMHRTIGKATDDVDNGKNVSNVDDVTRYRPGAERT